MSFINSINQNNSLGIGIIEKNKQKFTENNINRIDVLTVKFYGNINWVVHKFKSDERQSKSYIESTEKQN